MSANGYLADTHVFLWAGSEPHKLTTGQRRVLESPTRVYLSLAAIWEMSIKAGKGALDAPEDIGATAEAQGFDILHISLGHVAAVRDLPHHHRDPFDRLMVVQAQTEGLTLLTADETLKLYDVKTL